MAESRGERIRRLLKDRHITAKELAENVGVTETSMSRYIHDNRRPTSSTFAKIAHELNTSMDYLETGKDVNMEKWIPVTVEMPEEHRLITGQHMSNLCLVTVEINNGGYRNLRSCDINLTVDGHWLHKDDDEKVIAWMYIPEPYREG